MRKRENYNDLFGPPVAKPPKVKGPKQKGPAQPFQPAPIYTPAPPSAPIVPPPSDWSKSTQPPAPREDKDPEPKTGLEADNAWHLDMECIEAEGDYVDIIQRLAEMAGGAFDAQDVRCVFHRDDETATISLRLHGQKQEFSVDLFDDWLDGRIVDWVNSLLGDPDNPDGPDDPDNPAAPDDPDNPAARRFYVLPAGDQTVTVLFTDAEGYHRAAPAARKHGHKKFVVAAIVVMIIAAAIAVIGYGGNLPVLKDIPRQKVEAYLAEHLPVGFTYQGEDPVLSQDGARYYIYTTDATDATDSNAGGGLSFRCTARYRTGTGFMLYTKPTIACTYPIAYAHQYDDELAQAFSEWNYNRDFGTITLRDEADIPRAAEAIAEQLELIRAPINGDPDAVFVPFSLDVVWQPGAEKARPLGSFYQPLGDDPAPSAAEIQKALEEQL